MRLSSTLRISALCLVLGLPQVSFAGRPMSTDDAATAGDKHYQLEAWREFADNQHSDTVAPAVGFGDFEFGLELAKTHAPEGQIIRDKGVSLKWAPESFGAGPVRFGAKLWSGQSKDSLDESGTSSRENGGIAIASWTIADNIAAHLNLGLSRNRAEQRNERIANLAVSWAPHERVLVFAEALHQQYTATTQATGVRFWAIPEKLGLDLTASRQAGIHNSRTVGIGFGWYGDFGS